MPIAVVLVTAIASLITQSWQNELQTKAQQDQLETQRMQMNFQQNPQQQSQALQLRAAELLLNKLDSKDPVLAIQVEQAMLPELNNNLSYLVQNLYRNHSATTPASEKVQPPH